MGTEHSIVQILQHGQKPVGLGFVVDRHHVLTCAHVVNAALGRDLKEPAPPSPSASLIIDFPFLRRAGARFLRAGQVDKWAPEAGKPFMEKDVAGLAMGEPLPEDVPEVIFADTISQPVQMWGPSGQPACDGHVAGHLMGSVDATRSQVDQKLRGIFRVAQGFSGGPVWNPTTGQVVGMLQAFRNDEDAVDVYVLEGAALADEWPEVLWRPPPCPYRGLEAFDEKSAGLFFGRQDFVKSLVESSQRLPLVAVVGKSGSGKSSVVHAGLVPALRSSASVEVISMRPGERPILTLAAQLGGPHLSLREQGDSLQRLCDKGLVEHSALLCAARSVERVVLVIDQFEQLFGPRVDGAERVELLAHLRQVVAVEPMPVSLLVVLCIRQDFYGDLLVADQVLGDYLQSNASVLRSMTNDELHAAIVEPIMCADPHRPSTFDDGLVDRIIDDFRGQPGELPLLQFMLTLLWENQRKGRLTFGAYQRLGGVAKALAEYADRCINEMPAAGQEATRRIFTGLVLRGTRDVARRLRREELPEADWQIAQRLDSRRLVAIGRESGTGAETIEMAHEALLRAWGRLHEWLKNDSELIDWKQRTVEARDRSREGKGESGHLLRGSVLTRAEEMLERHPAETEFLRDFVNQSRRVQDEEDRERRELVGRLDALRLAAEADRVRLASATGLASSLCLGICSLERAATLEGDLAARRALTMAAKPQHRLTHDGPVGAVAFSPDGTSVATASSDGTARVFNATTGAETCRLTHDGPVGAVAFSPDGTSVATASDDRTGRAWAVTAGGVIEQVLVRLPRNLTPSEWARFRLGDYRKLRADLP